MNKYPSPIIIMLICVACFTVGLLTHIVFSPPRVPVPAALVGPERTFEDLLDAIEWVESKGGPWAVGDDGEVGAYQIRMIYLNDANRILLDLMRTPPRFDGPYDDYVLQIRRVVPTFRGWFQDQDRLNKKLSRQIVTTFLKHYGGTFEEMARKHNGGPAGHKKESTKPYWAKVQARLMTKEIK